MAGVKDQVKWSLDYLFTTHEESNLKNKRAGLRQNLSDYIQEHGVEDENGNLILEFDKLMTVDDQDWYSGLMLQRRKSEFINEDIARELIWKKDLTSRCIRITEVSEIDYDELYACNQEGLVTDEEIDTILEQEETWALVKIKA